MQYREFGNTRIRLSALGFGAMRLPRDEETAIRIIRRALELGVNYVDTAPGYGESEIIVGKAVGGWKSKIYLSTKNPLKDDTAEGWWSRLNQSLERMQTDHIDFYQVVHGLKWQSYVDNFSKPGAGLEAARRAKEQGIIGKICFSFHDTPQNLIKLIDTGEFEGFTVHYNLLDRSNEEAIAYAQEQGLGVVVMGPVGGGRLGAPSPQIQSMIPGGVASTAEAAMRFVLSNPNVTTAISGMSSMEMVEENVATASRTESLTADERERVQRMLEENKKLAELYCTGCNYCMPCPNDVNIPENFRYMNFHRVFGLTDYAKGLYRNLGSEGSRIPGKKAEDCIECGECGPKCPQNIPIIEQLKETAKALGE